MKLSHLALGSALALAACGAAFAAMTNDSVMVGGAPMYPTRNIVQNAVNSKDNTTLVAAVKAAGLVKALEGKGPFTVFAPTNEAFDMLPKGTVATLLEPKNKAELTSILLYHVVPGDFTFDTLRADIEGHGGMVKLPTLDKGHDLTFRMNGPHNIEVVDGKGNVAQIETYDVNQSNGVIQVIDRVLMP
ncbi:fasciclin domain-containing protein [Acidiphilium cryptum]|uniref:Beta-Ig-H3/fasciclin n=1 Tax=Acidiphilium cryptum (strain JF-5) TaxID=349163 RepID=A5G0Q6_ACICJ|nr:fasciclin domain-containing protein [Acidiphilium cryptum]ABQ31438.1 beta-Ig-H3/fasciclin [Acidiphilium cryptum JF-5]